METQGSVVAVVANILLKRFPALEITAGNGETIFGVQETHSPVPMFFETVAHIAHIRPEAAPSLGNELVRAFERQIYRRHIGSL